MRSSPFKPLPLGRVAPCAWVIRILDLFSLSPYDARDVRASWRGERGGVSPPVPRKSFDSEPGGSRHPAR